MSDSSYFIVSFIGLLYIILNHIFENKLKDRFNQPVFSTIFGFIFALLYYYT